jgi:hypothetical protein
MRDILSQLTVDITHTAVDEARLRDIKARHKASCDRYYRDWRISPSEALARHRAEVEALRIESAALAARERARRCTRSLTQVRCVSRARRPRAVLVRRERDGGG